MNYAKIIEIKGLQLTKVNYYTIWIDGNDNAEFRDFAIRMNLSLKNRNEFQELIVFINKIGNEYGALKRHFHHEAAADALSPPYLEHIDIESEKNDFGLRLYCMRITDSIVILFNGDRKTTKTAQDCSNCAKYFRLAQRLAKAIDYSIRESSLSVEYKYLLIEENFELTF